MKEGKGHMKKVNAKIISKRILSLVCVLAMIATFIPTVSAAPEDAEELPFVLFTESYAFNERVVAAVIDLGEGNSADGAALAKSMFSVNARAVREGTTTQAYNGARTIIDVYASETNTWKTDTTVTNQWAPPSTRGNGRYIVIKFKDWDGGSENPDNGALTASGQSLTPTYTITLNSGITLAGGESIDSASFVQTAVTGLIEDEFIASSITGNGQTTLYSYYLNEDAEGPLPLVIHLHGAQQGAHAKSPLRYSNNGTVWAYPENQAKNPCHVLVPSNGNGYTSNWTAGHIQNTGAIVKQMIEDGLVDPNRIYVTGYSMGGTGTMQFMAEFPELVAAAVPICIASPSYSALNATNAAKYADVPIWAFVNKGDSASIVNGMNTFFTTGAGATVLTNARYSVINNNETFIYPYVWTEYVGWDKNAWPTDAPNGVWDFGAHCSWIPVHNNKLADMAFQNLDDFDFASENGYEYVSDWMFSHGAPEDPAELPFTLVNDSQGFAERVSAAVIDLGEGVSANGATLTTDMFGVTVNNQRVGQSTFVTGSRTVLSVYATDDADDWTWQTLSTMSGADWGPLNGTGEGRYIVIKFKDWDGGGENPDLGSTRDNSRSLILNYSISLNKPIGLADGGSIAGADFTQAGVTGLIDDYYQAGSITGNGVTTNYAYYLNSDEEGNPNESLPLVIYFHGGGQGNDVFSGVRYSNGGTVWATPANQAKYPSHILAPQNASSESAIRNVGDVVRQMIADGLVDPNRVYVTGYSMGGQSTMRFLYECPDLVAAAVPICIAMFGTDPQYSAEAVEKYADIPLWHFVNQNDTTGGGSNQIIDTTTAFFTTGNGALMTNARHSIIKNNESYVYPYVWTEYVGWDKDAYPVDAPNGVWDFGAHCAWIPTYNNKMAEMNLMNADDVEYAKDYEYIIDWMFAQTNAPQLSVTTDANLVKKGDYFRVNAFFTKTVNSNTAVLNYSFDKAKFDYRGFTPAVGVGLVSVEQTDEGVKIILMIPDYNTKNYGEILMSAKENVDLEKADNEISLNVDYVALKDDGGKEIMQASASTTFTSSDDKGTGPDGEYTLIDLSNIIDGFGKTSKDSDWNKYRFYDFNGDGKITIVDITALAQKIK